MVHAPDRPNATPQEGRHVQLREVATEIGFGDSTGMCIPHTRRDSSPPR